MDMSLSKLREMAKDRKPGVLQPMQHKVGHDWGTEQQQDVKVQIGKEGEKFQGWVSPV